MISHKNLLITGMEYGGHRGAHPHQHQGQGQGASPVRPYTSSSRSPQDPTFPSHAHPCPQLSQPITEHRSFLPYPTHSSTTGYTGIAQAGRPHSFRHLPNPLISQGGSHVRSMSAVSNQTPASHVERPSIPMNYASHFHEDWIRRTSFDGMDRSASARLAAAQNQHHQQQYGPFDIPPTFGAQQSRTHPRDRNLLAAQYSPSAGAGTGTGNTSPTPRRRPHLPSYHRSTNSNGLCMFFHLALFPLPGSIL